jgi:hypothetical protein
VLIFLQVPKTGGSTLIHLLSAALQPALHIHQAPGVRKFLSFSQVERDSLRLVAGHMPYGIHRFTNQRFSYFTFLREPIDRVVPAYYYVKRTTEHPMRHRVAAGISLLQYMQEAEDNRQTRQLGRYDFAEILSRQKYWWARIPLRGVNREHLAVAKETLHSCHFVGLYENFAEDVCELFERLGLPRPLDIPRVLESVGRPRVAELEPHIVEEIRKEHLFDCELYEYACRLKDLRKKQDFGG